MTTHRYRRHQVFYLIVHHNAIQNSVAWHYSSITRGCSGSNAYKDGAMRLQALMHSSRSPPAVARTHRVGQGRKQVRIILKTGLGSSFTADLIIRCIMP